MRYPYRAGNPEAFDVFKAFGVERKMTPFASEITTRLAATLGSFAKTKETLALLGHGTVSVSKIRGETPAAGEKALEASRTAGVTVRASCRAGRRSVREVNAQTFSSTI